MQLYRDNGVIGALLDEYEKAITALKTVITDVTSVELTTIVDSETKDTDCRSIQTILTHVVRSGNCYVVEIRKSLGEEIDFVERKKLDTVEQYQKALDVMFTYSEKLFTDYPDITLIEKNNNKKIVVRWGQSYDIEQLFEHAIVHILRHRRQIERFLLKLRNA